MSATIQDHVYRRLRELSGMDDARELLSVLNYDYDTGSVPVTIPESSRARLSGDPQVIARHGDFRVIHTRFSGDKLLHTPERDVVNALLKTNPYSLFLFSDQDDSDWHFVNVKHEGPNATKTFRRISIGPDERIGDRLRTPAEQLSKIALQDEEQVAPLELQSRHDRAFDVDIVTKRFYDQYSKVFRKVEAQVQGLETDEDKRIFTQRLFNRLMFVAFVQKKGWLRLNGKTDYLNELWRSYRQSPDPNGFYRGRLKNLFFVALDNPSGRDYVDGPSGASLRPVLGDVHYLNGGLFEQNDHDRNDAVGVPDSAIGEILEDLFDRFNFTVTESTPFDQEVAVDPEMLGKVFEELVTGRHETGSYYTPKPIVSFMCREALKAYLRSGLPDEPAAAIEAFVDEQQPEGLRDPEAVLDRLKRVTACDPACGSGAYLLGLLHELLELRRSLFSSRSVDPLSDYRRKLEIIQNNLYGVDIDPFAINIARLRLWLSLAIDFEGDRPEPLPNLDFKIEVGDSLTARHVGESGQLGLRQAQIEAFQGLKVDYLTAHGEEKRRLQREILDARKTLGDLTHGGATVQGFDWPVEFAEVFANGGFDVVLANPPYVRQELIKELKPRLKDVYGPLYSGTADLYVYFYYRALQLLKPGGALAFISSDKWFRAAYGAKLRAHIAETTDVLSITDFGDLPVFESATAYPMIFTAHKGVPSTDARYTEVKSLDPPYPEVKLLIEQDGTILPPTAFDGDRWMLTDAATVNLIRRMETDTIPLGKYVNGQIYRGVLTGFNQAFVIDGEKRAELIANDPRSEEIIKPLAVGRDIRRWSIDYKDRWLIFTRRGIKIRDYPAIRNHLSQWRTDLQPKAPGAPRDAPGRKPGSYQWYEIQDNVAYFGDFDRPKIIYPVIGIVPSFAYDMSGAFTNDKGFIIPVDELFLLGILNSASVWNFLESICSRLRGGHLELRSVHVATLPIPKAGSSDYSAITSLVTTCIEHTRTKSDAASYEAEINARVARLYGLPEPRTEN